MTPEIAASSPISLTRMETTVNRKKLCHAWLSATENITLSTFRSMKMSSVTNGVDRELYAEVILQRNAFASEVAKLRADLAAAKKELEEAADDIAAWGAYAGDYFKDKHDLEGDVARVRGAAARIDAALKGGE
jgi:hypothetical protein